MKIHLLKGCLLLVASIFSISSSAQFWTEDFGVGCDQGNLAAGTVTANGAWSVTTTGANGGGANTWFISATEAGMGVGNCGDGCLASPAETSRTLHVANIATGTGACLFCPTGDCGAAYADGTTDFGLCPGSMDPTMNARAESPIIDCTGESTITLDMAYITLGQAGVDFCTVEYFDGAVWSTLGVPTPSVDCGGGQHTWTAYSIALPASADNNPNVRIGFRWEQVVDDGGADPSFAVDDIELTVPTTGSPTASFTTPITTICEGDCIDFTDASTLGANPVWAWTFTGAATAASAVQNPTGICYPTAGTYDVSLTVTDDDGTDTDTQVGYITVVAPGNAGNSVTQNLCNNTTLDLNTIIGAADPGTWLETSGVPSGQFTAGTGVLDGNGLTAGNQYTFTHTVSNAPCTDVVATVTIDIINCSGTPPTADFTVANQTICAGDCLDFTDLSMVGTNPSWSWTFNGAVTGTSTDQNPTNICYLTPGTYDVTLIVTDDGGMDTHTEVAYITVNASPMVTATAAPNDTICDGDQVTLTGAGATTYVWDNGVVDGVAFTPTATTTYMVTGTDANGCTRDATIQVVVENCTPLVANWGVASTNICAGDCIVFTDSSTGNIGSWAWDFGGGATPNTSSVPSPTVCFPASGTFTVELTITQGADVSTFSQVISVFDGPTVTATLDTLIDLGGTADLVAVGSGPGSYSWDPPEFVACDTCAITTASPYLNTIYIVTHTDINGCSGEDTVTVNVNFIEGIDVPSAFSPNGDGNNDILFVKGIGIESMTFTIYNRYGQKVFECDNQDIGWDGTFRGRDENSGVFTWMLEYRLVNQATGLLKGNTTLLR